MSDTFDKKPEKLASAIYLISGFFNDQEPLKWKLRTLASEFIAFAVSLKERQIATIEIKDIVLKITGFISVAKNAGLISIENHNLMQEELTKYIETLDYPVNISDFLNIESQKSEMKKLEERPVRSIMIKDKPLKEFGAVSVKKNSRQNIIISILKRKKEIMIKDISPMISGCSEKTIQRELSAMVQTGILRKIGEKRWSRYSLA